MKEKIDAIELLRIISSVGVALFHIGTYTVPNVNLSAGVYLLFTISAFLMMLTSRNGLKKHFLLNRLLRLLPLYWLLTITTFFSALLIPALKSFQGNISFTDFIMSMLLIPYSRASIKSGNVIRPIVGPAWTMYYDVSFAVIFLLAASLSQKHRGKIAAGICFILILLRSFLPREIAAINVYTNPLWYYFIAGIVLYWLWNTASEQLTRPLRMKSSTIFRILFGIASAVCLFALFCSTYSEAVTSLFTFGAILFLMLCLYGIKLPGFVAKLSRLSYSFYLIHYFVIIVLSKVFDFSVLGGSAILGTLVMFIISYLLAWCAYQLIEKKAVPWLMSRLSPP